MSKTAGTDLKRLPTKLVRDRVKSRYPRGTECEICGTTENVEFHHYHTFDILFEKWLKKNSLKITCTQDVLDCRDDFIAEHEFELIEDAANLCKKHHQLLHKVYGQKPLLSTGPKQKRWVEKQRDKHYK